MSQQKNTFFFVETIDGKTLQIDYIVHYEITKDNAYNIVFSVDEIIDAHITEKTLLFGRVNNSVNNSDLEHLKDMMINEIHSHLSKNDISVEKLTLSVSTV